MKMPILVLLTLCLTLWACNDEQNHNDDLQDTDKHLSITDTLLLLEKQDSLLPLVFPSGADTNFIDIKKIAPTVLVDMPYATEDNFVKKRLYNCSRCILRPAVAEALAKIQAELKVNNTGLLLYDCYRPALVQQELWNTLPDKRYVSPPSRGSMHNRGAAVDLTLVDSLGTPLDMGTAYDYFGREAWHRFPHNDTIRHNRKMLRNIMEKNGFKSITTEWWHYSFTRKSYPIASHTWNCE